jgi:hypothetical protein
MPEPAKALQSAFVLDEPAFRSKVPFALNSTTLKGVFVSPAPADDLDPNTASATDLIKNGILWRRPAATDDPALKAAWNQIFSRKWLAKDRIVPALSPQVGKTHILKSAPKKITNSNYIGYAWSGAGTFTGGPWTTVIGYWKVPTVSKAPEPAGPGGGWDSSSWLGIDGMDFTVVSTDVLQAGIQQTVSSSGQTAYIPWFEWYAPPQAGSPSYIWQTNITNFPVSPGDQIYCSVQYVGKTAGSIYLANEATGKHFSITLAPPPGATFSGNTVEWIMEDPDGGEPGTALAKFTPVVFTSAMACNSSSAINNPSSDSTCNIETTGGKALTKTTLGNYTVTIDFIG